MSAGPPAGKGTTRVSGLVGKAACARAPASGRAARPATMPRRMMLNSYSSRYSCRLCARNRGEASLLSSYPPPPAGEEKRLKLDVELFDLLRLRLRRPRP